MPREARIWLFCSHPASDCFALAAPLSPRNGARCLVCTARERTISSRARVCDDVRAAAGCPCREQRARRHAGEDRIFISGGCNPPWTIAMLGMTFSVVYRRGIRGYWSKEQIYSCIRPGFGPKRARSQPTETTDSRALGCYLLYLSDPCRPQGNDGPRRRAKRVCACTAH